MSIASVVDEFEHHADAAAQRFAIRVPEGRAQQSLTFEELDRWANAIASDLLARRGPAAEPVPLLICSTSHMLAAQLGVLKAGKFFIPVNPLEPAARVAFVLHELAAPLVISDQRSVQAAGGRAQVRLIEELVEGSARASRPGLQVDEERLAYVAYTSGSTGQPKGVAQTRRHMRHNIARHALLGVGHPDCVTLISSDGFVTAISNSYLALLNGATLAPYSFRESGVDGMFDWLAALNVTVLYGFPSFLRQLVVATEPGRSYSGLRLVYLGGETVLTTDLAAARRLFPRADLSTGLNSTETGLLCAQLFPRSSSLPDPVPVGRTVADVELAILGDDDAALPPGEPGQIEVRSAFVRPYIARPDGFDEVATKIAPGRFAYRTHDRARVDADGVVFHAGRVGGMVKIRGFRVEIAEIETAIAALDDVAVVPVGDGSSTELAAFVAARRAGLDARTIRGAVARVLPAAMIPNIVQLVNDLPRTANGKADRKALAARAREMPPAPATPATTVPPPAPGKPDDVPGYVVAILRAILGTEQIALDDNFFALGGTSISALRVVSQVRREFGVPVPLGVVFDSPTVGAIVDVVAQLRGASAPETERANTTSLEIRELMALQKPVRMLPLLERRQQLDRAEVAFANDAPGPGPLVDAGGCAAEWVLAHHHAAQPIAIYIHGGGYTVGSPRSHRHLAAAVGRAIGAAVLAVDYRLAPESGFPSAVDDCVAAARWVIDQSDAPIVLVGDSAGGGLVVATLLALRDAGLRLPAAGVCISPWVDLSCSGESHTTRADRDPMLTPAELRDMAAGYMANGNPRHPMASPVFADLTGLPPLLIQVGSEEILLDDARALASAAERAGVDATLEEWPDMVHVWHWFFPVLAEGRRAIEGIAAFVRRHTTAAAVVNTAPRAADGPRRGPASLTQEAHILGASADADRGYLSWVYQLNGRLNVPALAQAVDDVVSRHEILRTRFERARGRWYQIVTPFQPPALTIVDLGGQPKLAALNAAVERAEAIYSTLSTPDDPRFQAFLYTIDPKTSVLAMFVADALVDSDSGPLVAAEISRAYAARAGQAEPAALSAPSAISYLDYVASHPLDSLAAQHARDYWERLARSAPGVGAWPMVLQDRTVTSAFQLTPEDWARFQRSIQAMGTTAYIFILASFQIALSRLVGLSHFLIHSTVSNRSDPVTERMIGNFHSPVRIEARIQPADRFSDVVQRTAESVYEAVTHCIVPPPVEPAPAVRFHMFDYHEGPMFAGTRRRRFRLHSASRAPLRLNSIRGPNGRQDFVLSSATASQDVLASLGRAVRAVLDAAVAEPAIRADAIDIAPPAPATPTAPDAAEPAADETAQSSL